MYIVADESSQTEGKYGYPLITFEGSHIFFGKEKAQSALDKYNLENPDSKLTIYKIEQPGRTKPLTVDSAIKAIWGKLPEGKSYVDVKRQFDNSPFNPKNLNRKPLSFSERISKFIWGDSKL